MRSSTLDSRLARGSMMSRGARAIACVFRHSYIRARIISDVLNGLRGI
jgi:hypothetical protein